MTRLPKVGGDDGTWGQILNSYLGQAHAADGSLKPGTVGSSQLQSGAVGSAQLQDNAVGTSKLQDDVVGTAKIQIGAVTSDKLAADSVTSGAIANDSVTTSAIADDTVSPAKLQAGIPQAKIDGLTSTLDNMVSSVNGQTGDVSITSDGSIVPTATQPAAFVTASAGGQGLASDGQYFYWGKNNGNGTPGSIKKINPADGTVVATFSAPQHAAGVDYARTRGSLFATSDQQAQETWEIDASTGAKLRSWDLSSLRSAAGTQGGLVAWDDSVPAGNVIYQLIGDDATMEFQINRVQVNNDGTFVDLGKLLDSPKLGTLQGMTCRDGEVYLLVDDVQGHDLRSVYRFKRSGAALVQDRKWAFITPDEAEGLTFHNGELYYGDSTLQIWNAPFQPWHDLLLSQGMLIMGDSGVADAASNEVMLEIMRTSTGHAAIQVDSHPGYDQFIYMSESGVGKWDIRHDSSRGQFQIRSYPNSVVALGVNAAGTQAILGGTTINNGAGSPEGVVVAGPGAMYLNTSGGAGQTLWVKETGTGNTGWAAK